MSQKKNDTPLDLTADQLRERVSYDVDTGYFSWRYRVPGCVPVGAPIINGINSRGYVRLSINGHLHLMHRLVWLYVHGVWPSGQIDHINGNRTDNRIENLRDVSASMNLENQRAPRSNNKSGFLGVVKDNRKWRQKRFQAVIVIRGKRHSLGYFSTGDEAHEAYVNAKRLMHVGCTI